MKIAIPAEDKRGLESNVSGHFGRAKYFVFVDVEDNKIKNAEVVEVPFEEHGPGDLPNFIKEHGGEVVLAYGMGRRAIDYFNQLGIEVVTGAYGKIEDVVDAFIHQVLEVDPHWKEKIEREKEKEEHCGDRECH
ncbi:MULTISPECIES: NifB/NifX family molybdenum-iron cluster-binding protein [Thermococcus]|uniref:Iron-molybdenum cofactor-binding protein n=2 Tax=Thermococcus sibiricus TaxID=172049 RepID=C6A547_THESM|nr:MULTISPECIES: NifB/NifX family molybdenum-iron cluster-binding protein [Thermococcus]ACS90742.1 Iron-molybdenum cofactor-binding protein [Thermococcus sibiricus MM 739]KUK17500.1 MAG: Iron-molybdenum cofactor-binding protein [Thermococcus sibiricus]MBC7094235.1 NifB/NifX family molybdenum-iron cluster-binding protein [Thermococcus sp.]